MDVDSYFCIFYNLRNVQRNFRPFQAGKKKERKKGKRKHVQRKTKSTIPFPTFILKPWKKGKKYLTKVQPLLQRQTEKSYPA